MGIALRSLQRRAPVILPLDVVEKKGGLRAQNSIDAVDLLEDQLVEFVQVLEDKLRVDAGAAGGLHNVPKGSDPL